MNRLNKILSGVSWLAVNTCQNFDALNQACIEVQLIDISSLATF